MLSFLLYQFIGLYLFIIFCKSIGNPCEFSAFNEKLFRLLMGYKHENQMQINFVLLYII